MTESRIEWTPGTLVYPVPAALVSVGGSPADYNLITIAWTGTLCSTPPLAYISVRRERHSYALLQKYREFAINLTTTKIAFATDWCGVKSGRDHAKFSEMKLTARKAAHINAPYVAESPLAIECRVKEIIPLGSHDMFIAEVVGVSADAKYLDPKTGAFDLARAGLLAYAHGKYYELGKFVGDFGWSVRKHRPAKNKSPKNAKSATTISPRDSSSRKKSGASEISGASGRRGKKRPPKNFR